MEHSNDNNVLVTTWKQLQMEILAVRKLPKRPTISSETDQYKESIDLCEQCGKNWRFEGSDICFDCAAELLKKGRNVLHNWNRIAAHKEVFHSCTFAGGVFNNGPQKLSKRTFVDCDFSKTHFHDMDFSHCKFERANFTDATFENCLFHKTSFDSCLIRFGSFIKCNFLKAKLSNLELMWTTFINETKFNDTSFDSTRCFKIYFDTCDFRRAKFYGKSSLIKTLFFNSNLSYIDLTCTKVDVLLIGGKSQVKGLHVLQSQRRKKMVAFMPEVSWQYIVLLQPTPTWSLQRKGKISYREAALTRKVCVGIEENIHVILNCLGTANLIGLVYCLFSGAFIRTESLIKAFFLSIAISFVLLVIPALCSVQFLLRKRTSIL